MDLHLNTGEENEQYLGPNRILQSKCYATYPAGTFPIPPMPLEGSITSDKQLEMGWDIGTTGLVCWHLLPKYAVLLLGEGCSWQFCYLLAGPCNLPMIISGYFLNLTMAKTKNKAKTPEISLKILHPGKHTFPWETGVWANNPVFAVAVLLSWRAPGVPWQQWSKSWDVHEILIQGKFSLKLMAT